MRWSRVHRDGSTVTGQRVDVSDRTSVDVLVATVPRPRPAAHAGAHRRALPHAGIGAACARRRHARHRPRAQRVPRRRRARAPPRSASRAWRATWPSLTRAQERRSPRPTPTGSWPRSAASTLDDFGATYSVAKRVNQLRVEQAAVAWGARGGGSSSISPGIISTPDGPPGARRGRRRADAGHARHLAGAAHRHRRGHRRRGAVAGQPGGVVRQRLRPPRRRRGHRRRARLPGRG